MRPPEEFATSPAANDPGLAILKRRIAKAKLPQLTRFQEKLLTWLLTDGPSEVRAEERGERCRCFLSTAGDAGIEFTLRLMPLPLALEITEDRVPRTRDELSQALLDKAYEPDDLRAMAARVEAAKGMKRAHHRGYSS